MLFGTNHDPADPSRRIIKTIPALYEYVEFQKPKFTIQSAFLQLAFSKYDNVRVRLSGYYVSFELQKLVVETASVLVVKKYALLIRLEKTTPISWRGWSSPFNIFNRHLVARAQLSYTQLSYHSVPSGPAVEWVFGPL